MATTNGRLAQRNIPDIWPTILTNEERVRRFIKVYQRNRKLGVTNNHITARDMKVSRTYVSNRMNEPTVLYTLKYAYLYDIDPLEIFPELIWLRDRWVKEFQEHLTLLKQAANLKNPNLILELVEACEYGLTMYLNPELLGEMKKLQGESINLIALAQKGQKRRKKHESRLEARLRADEDKAPKGNHNRYETKFDKIDKDKTNP